MIHKWKFKFLESAGFISRGNWCRMSQRLLRSLMIFKLYKKKWNALSLHESLEINLKTVTALFFPKNDHATVRTASQVWKLQRMFTNWQPHLIKSPAFLWPPWKKNKLSFNFAAMTRIWPAALCRDLGADTRSSEPRRTWVRNLRTSRPPTHTQTTQTGHHASSLPSGTMLPLTLTAPPHPLPIPSPHTHTHTHTHANSYTPHHVTPPSSTECPLISYFAMEADSALWMNLSPGPWAQRGLD